jgi:hypothetical protein
VRFSYSLKNRLVLCYGNCQFLLVKSLDLGKQIREILKDERLSARTQTYCALWSRT